MKFVVSDGRTIPLPDESIDFIFSHSVIEHLDDVHQSFSELNRIAKTGGYIYLTVSPLYFSARGAHSRHIPLWHHLMPNSPFFLTQAPLGEDGRVGAHLNKYTVAMFLAEVGNQPWDIVRMARQREKSTPPAEATGQASPLDMMTRGFKIMLQENAIPTRQATSLPVH